MWPACSTENSYGSMWTASCRNRGRSRDSQTDDKASFVIGAARPSAVGSLARRLFQGPHQGGAFQRVPLHRLVHPTHPAPAKMPTRNFAHLQQGLRRRCRRCLRAKRKFGWDGRSQTFGARHGQADRHQVGFARCPGRRGQSSRFALGTVETTDTRCKKPTRLHPNHRLRTLHFPFAGLGLATTIRFGTLIAFPMATR